MLASYFSYIVQWYINYSFSFLLAAMEKFFMLMETETNITEKRRGMCSYKIFNLILELGPFEHNSHFYYVLVSSLYFHKTSHKCLMYSCPPCKLKTV